MAQLVCVDGGGQGGRVRGECIAAIASGTRPHALAKVLFVAPSDAA